MAFDLKSALTTIAPTLATMLGGPLAGTAVSALESVFGLAPGAGADGITKVIQSGGMTPEAMAAIRLADQKHAEIIAQQGIDVAKMNLDFQSAQTLAVIDDRKDARKANSNRDAVWWIAVVILATFAIMMGAVLYGCWMLLQGGITIKDVSVVAAISGLVGSVVGYVAANAQTVVNFIYGGSLGSEKKTDALAASVQQAIGTTK
jgi:hypothetical protein